MFLWLKRWWRSRHRSRNRCRLGHERRDDGTSADGGLRSGPTSGHTSQLREGRVEWLLSLLQSYPGSRWGTVRFAGSIRTSPIATYVETRLEETLYCDVRERRVRLVILCGNAGDGKTALLQHLATRLGLGRHSSSERVLKGKMNDGLVVPMNLDGSAAWQRTLCRQDSRRVSGALPGRASPREHCPLACDQRRSSVGVDRRCRNRRGGKGTSLTHELYGLLQQETFHAKSPHPFHQPQSTIVGRRHNG